MTFLNGRSSYDILDEARVADESTWDDWLGLAGYLADAVAAGDVTVDEARTELATAATSRSERRALRRAAEVAATQLGAEAPVTTMLHWAVTDGAPPPKWHKRAAERTL